MSVSILISLLLVMAATTSSAQEGTFTSLFSFPTSPSPAEGAGPKRAALIQGQDGLLYGTTSGEGINLYGGTVFRITTDGRPPTVLHTFTYCPQKPCLDGSNPYGGLVQDGQGNLYGTTVNGGEGNYGTIFRITPAGGTPTILYSFCKANPQPSLGANGCPDGANPADGVILGADGNLYGTTQYGGGDTIDEGTIFRISTSGNNFKTLHVFTVFEGYLPLGIMQASSGTFYGVTYQSGVVGNGTGTIFKMTTSGLVTTVTTLVTFCSVQELQTTNCPNGAYPTKAPIQAKDGNLYGVTSQGGAPNAPSAGTIYKMTPIGAFSRFYTFCEKVDCPDGSGPSGGIIQATDGNFYGTTSNGHGTIFQLTPSGTLNPLYRFCSQVLCDDGSTPWAPLLQDTNGILYGTTYSGGTGGIGTVFNMNLGLGAFLTSSPSKGRVGTKVLLLGSNLASATAVSFNGTPATFTVSSGGGSINTTVPATASTGPILVTTLTDTISTTVSFKVIPQITSFTPSSGPVGTQVTITGVSLTQTSKVTIGGVKASSLTVDSDTQVTATVPTGAKTGKIVITTPGGSATSAATFTVM